MYIFEVLTAFFIAGVIVYIIKSIQSKNEIIISSIKYYVESTDVIRIENKSQVNFILKMCKKYNIKKIKSDNFDGSGLIDINKIKEKLVI